MPKVSEWTELMGDGFLDWVDGMCEEIKSTFGWPPLGKAELSPSGVRAREKGDAAILADLFTRLGPEKSLDLLRAGGVELLGAFSERVVGEAMREASAAFQRQMGMDGREDYVEPAGGGG